MKIVFMGTPEFASVALQGLINEGHDVVLVITQPDKPRGRSKKLIASEVKQLALENGIEVVQPKRIKKDVETIDKIRNLNPDVIIVAAFGQILPKEVIEIPKYGCINIHASILPKYRGAAPINWSIINGEKVTGVTIMQMDEGLDTGDIIEQEEIFIDDEMDCIELTDELASLGIHLLSRVLNNINKIKKVKQNDNESSYAPMLNKELGKIDFNKSAEEIHNLIRGIVSWPTATAVIKGKNIKFFKSFYSKVKSDAKNGEVIEKDKHQFGIKCGLDSILYVREVQLEGKKKMPVSAFLQGFNLNLGDSFE